jgi:glycosyltransferase involved in cell wall biosynthesis
MHVITGLDVGGAEGQLAILARAQHARGRTPYVVSLTGMGSLGAGLQADCIPVFSLGLTRGRPRPAGIFRLVRLIRRYRPRIVQSWMYHADLLAALALRVSGRWYDTPLVWGVRCSDMELSRYPKGLRRVVRLAAFFSFLPDIVVFNSDTGLAVHNKLGYRPHRTRIIDNAIDTEKFQPDQALRHAVRQELGIAPGTPLLAHVARVDPMKDHAMFLQAMTRLGDVEALVIGLGTEDLPAQRGVHRLGQRDDIARLLPACDFVVSSSAFGEGFSNVLAEGMAAGLPAVATDIGDAARIVEGSGLVVPPGDPAALAAAIQRLVSESMAARLARRLQARDSIERRFSLARAAAAYDELYAALI